MPNTNGFNIALDSSDVKNASDLKQQAIQNLAQVPNAKGVTVDGGLNNNQKPVEVKADIKDVDKAVNLADKAEDSNTDTTITLTDEGLSRKDCNLLESVTFTKKELGLWLRTL